MQEGAKEPTEFRVPVGEYGSGGYPEHVSFRGTQVREVPVIMEDEEDRGRDRTYTIYSTPDDGLRIHEHETVREGSYARRPGQRAAEIKEVSSRLFTEAELRQERGEALAEMILDRD